MTGFITPLKPLDFESLKTSTNENVYPLYLTVKAKDFGNPSLFSTVPVVIYLQDVNDHSPRFERPFYSKSVPENIKSGTTIMEVIPNYI